MAKRVEVLLIDDVDGSQADESLPFAFDGISYEIDLSDGNAERFRDAMAPWLAHARRVAGRPGVRKARSGGKPPVSSPPPPRSDATRAASNGVGGEDRRAIREWARAKNINVSARGRIPQSIVDRYRAAGN